MYNLLHKAGEKLDINNYSGISLQNCKAKLFSAAINCRIVTYYEIKGPSVTSFINELSISSDISFSTSVLKSLS
jgi:hypothetical protein